VCFQEERTVYRWIQSYKRNGIGSIFPGYYQNENASKLSKKQKEEIKEILEREDFPADYWSMGELKNYVSARFDVEYKSDQSYYGIFSMCNYSYKLPSLFNIRRDEEFVEKRMQEIKAEIDSYLKDENSLVFCSDESRIDWTTMKRRAWLRKGKKTVIKERRERDYQSFIGFLNIQTGEDLLYRLDWQDQEHIIPVLTNLVEKYPNKKIVIIWDNAAFHRGQKIRALLGEGKLLQNIKLIWLPPYAPDKNPQERVWNYGKKELANKVFNQFEDMVSSFEDIITGRLFHYQF